MISETTESRSRVFLCCECVLISFLTYILTIIPSDCFPQEEKQRKLLRVRLEMAKFLQETLRESGLKANAHIVGSDAFKEFFRKVSYWIYFSLTL